MINLILKKVVVCEGCKVARVSTVPGEPEIICTISTLFAAQHWLVV